MAGQRNVISLSRGFDKIAEVLETGSIDDIDYYEYKDDPLGFVDEVLGVDLWDTQKEILLAIKNNEKIAVKSCNAIGKTCVIACAILWFLHCFRPSTAVSTAPSGRQVKEILWNEITEIYHKAKRPLGGRLLTTYLDMSDKEKWFGIGFSTDEHRLEMFQGFHNVNVLVVLDEASGIESSIHEAVEGILTGELVRLVQIGNPNDEATKFGECFTGKSSDLYKKFHVSAYDTPNFTTFGITEENIENNNWEEKIGDDYRDDNGRIKWPRPYLMNPKRAWEIMKAWGKDHAVYQVRVGGEFPEITTDTLIPLSWVERAQRRNLEPEGEKALGVDVARMGDDKTTVYYRIGNKVVGKWSWGKFDTMYTANRVARIIQDNGIPPENVRIDEIGLGGGPVDRLKEMGFPVKGINVEAKAYDPEFFASTGIEAYWNLRLKFENGEIDLLEEDDDLKYELPKLKYEYKKGRLWMRPKNEAKKKLGRSPDHAEGLMLCFYERRNVFSDLGSIQTPKKSSTETFEDHYKIPQKMDDINRIINERIFTKKETTSSEMCPICNKSIGLVYRTGIVAVQPNEAENRKCLLCNTKWIKVEGEWKEE